MTKYLISIVGPTAIGKTALSLALAKHFNTEIISADSRQFYKEMCIGTAVPSTKERHAATHHFIQHQSIHQPYNVGDFETEAIKTLDTLYQNHNVVIMVGGSGLYVNAVNKGLDNFPKVNIELREQLNKQFTQEGIKPLQQQLKQHDEKAYNTIAIDNPHRVIRALEVCLSSGATYSSFLSHSTKKRNFKTISIGLTAKRTTIYNRINQRVDAMITAGLIHEAKGLYTFKQLNALNTVGYKELFRYFDGHWNLEFAISEIKKNTRRFAKRQLTWFKKDQSIRWFDYQAPLVSILQYLRSIMH